MPNRVVIQADINNYAAQFVGAPRQMQIGDIILNTRTGTHADGKGALFYSTIATVFAGARNGANIWIDGATLGVIYDFRFTNGGTGTEFAISDSTHYATFRLIPGTQLKCVRNTSSNNGYTVLILDIKFWKIYAENDAYPGMRDGVGNSVFLRGRFGWWISGGLDLNSAHQLSIDAIDGGNFEGVGVEIEHGFSASRYTGGSYDRTVSGSMRRCYLHDGISGEGFYWGATHAAPLAKLKGITIDDCIIARRAAESIQLQHLINDPGAKARVQHFVVYCGATDWVNAFQPNQDSGIQWSLNTGGNYMQNFIVDGCPGNQFVIYGSPDYASDGGYNIVQRGLFHNGGNIFLYIQNSTNQGLKAVFRRLVIRGFTDVYFEDTGEAVQAYMAGSNNGSDKNIFMNIKYDNSKAAFFQNSSSFDILNVTNDNTTPAPSHIRSGFSNAEVKRLRKWSEFWGDYWANTNGTRMTIRIDDILINAVDGVEYKFYKALTNHSATAAKRPDLSPTDFVLLTWDTAGTRSDKAGFNSGSVQSDYPPDDLRQTADSTYNVLKYGLRSNPMNTTYTQIQIFRSKDLSGSGAVAIPGANTVNYTPEEADYNMYLFLGVRVKDANGVFGDWRYSNKTLVQ